MKSIYKPITSRLLIQSSLLTAQLLYLSNIELRHKTVKVDDIVRKGRKILYAR